MPNSVRLQAFRRSDFDGFAKRMASGEVWRDAWRNANNGFEQLLYETKKMEMKSHNNLSSATFIHSPHISLMESYIHSYCYCFHEPCVGTMKQQLAMASTPKRGSETLLLPSPIRALSSI